MGEGPEGAVVTGESLALLMLVVVLPSPGCSEGAAPSLDPALSRSMRSEKLRPPSPEKVPSLGAAGSIGTKSGRTGDLAKEGPAMFVGD